MADALVPSINFSVVEYERTPEEIDLAKRAQQLTMDFRHLGLRLATRLPAASISSPLAAQSQAWAAADSLRQLRNRLAHGFPGQPEDKRIETLGAEALPELERLRANLMRFGDDVDFLERDSKWEAFVSELRRRGALLVSWCSATSRRPPSTWPTACKPPALTSFHCRTVASPPSRRSVPT